MTCDISDIAYNENLSSSIMDEDLKEISHCQDDEDDEKCYVNKIENYYYQLVFTSTLYPNKNKTLIIVTTK